MSRRANVLVLAILTLSMATTSLHAETSDDGAILLKAGKVYATPDRVITNGEVLIANGKILKIGRDLTAPEDATVIELPNGTITAGLIDANATAGYRDANDRAEHRSEIIPNLRVLDLLDLQHDSFGELARSGVTTVYVSADSASVIGGQGTILRTAGPLSGRTVRQAYGVKATIGREPIYKGSRNRRPSRRYTNYLARRPNTRMGLVWTFRKAFQDAGFAARGEQPATRGEGTPPAAALPVLVDILKGERPLRIQARAQHDILTALRLCREFDLRFTLEEGTDAYRCIDELKAAGVAVIYGPLFDYPSGYRATEARRHRYSAPAEILKGGLTLALSANGLAGEAALPQQAMYAMRFGLTRSQALAAVTTTPAKLLEIDDVAGTLAKGRSADVVLWSGEPLAATTRAEVVVIGGRLVHNLTADDQTVEE